MRHLCTIYLWVQERLRVGHFRLQKVRDTENVADVLTKSHTEQTLLKWLHHLGFETN